MTCNCMCKSICKRCPFHQLGQPEPPSFQMTVARPFSNITPTTSGAFPDSLGIGHCLTTPPRYSGVSPEDSMDEPLIYDVGEAVALICRETKETPEHVRLVMDLKDRFMELAGIARCSETDQEALAQERLLYAELLPDPESPEFDRDALLWYMDEASGLEAVRTARILAAEMLYLEQAGIADPGAQEEYLAWVEELQTFENWDPDKEGSEPDRIPPERPRARHLSSFSDYKNEPLVCPECGWKGTWVEGSHDYFDSLVDCSCPADGCSGPMLAIVAHPTIAEWEEHKACLSPAEQAFGDAQVVFQEAFKAAALKDAAQLPDLEGEALDLVWDKEGAETVLRHEGREMWREPSVWEGYSRFMEVLALLKERYGLRLRDVAPTPASEMDLYGEKTTAYLQIDEALKGLWKVWGTTHSDQPGQ